ncbi:MAG: ATP-dependent zinc metalloprotease FtsH, partial [Clostridia bacterium]|nr:ATP-dependent zinc metalloprotease FtsH [Clostridia bacterium]
MKEVKRPRKQMIWFYTVALAVLLLFNLIAMPRITENRITEVDYGTFMTMTAAGNIGKVEISTSYIVFTDKAEENIYKTGALNDPDLIQRLHESNAVFSGEIAEEASPLLSFVLSWVFPILFFIILGNILSKAFMKKAGGNNSMMFNMGKSNAKIYVKSSDGIRFSDVAGVDEAKESLKEVVDYLDNPEKYSKIGASMPKGVLLVGPPGTGKTMIAKAVAGEANVPFFSMSGSEFVEMFVGMGASKVRDLFKQAKEKAPCIIFIDEIDAIGQRRDGRLGSNDEREQTLNQLLTEMDGFEGNAGVIILAATNRPETLDPALTRPGRFDRRIPVELPDLKGREAILKVHSQKIKTDGKINYLSIARMASGASGAELANIINESALRAVRAGREEVTQPDLEESIEVVIAGYRKNNSLLTDNEKLVVAYHEMGHAIVAAKQPGSAPIQKITIVPRTSGALGYTLQAEKDNRYLLTKSEIENKISILTAGRAAEQVGVGTVTTGASND